MKLIFTLLYRQLLLLPRKKYFRWKRMGFLALVTFFLLNIPFIGGFFGLVPGLPYQYIILIWVYAFVERMIISDAIKVMAYKLFDHKGLKFHRHGQVHTV